LAIDISAMALLRGADIKAIYSRLAGVLYDEGRVRVLAKGVAIGL
jgi:hypothetical protein